MSDLDVAQRLVDALARKDKQALSAVLHPDIVLNAPFPLGKKQGREKTAKALLNVAKLGAGLHSPSEADGVLTATVKSPAGEATAYLGVSDEQIVSFEIRKD